MSVPPRAAATVLREVAHQLDGAGIDARGTLVVGFSGGPDSLALLWALATLRGEGRGPRVVALHVDHQLRSDSARDAEDAVVLAQALGVPVEVERVEIRVWPEYRLEGTEAAARVARYAALGRAVGRHQASGIAVGHTRDDQAETVLLRLLRGVSLEGLAGMRPVSRRRVRLDPADPVGIECTVVRPLLRIGRDQVHACLSSLHLTPLEDPSNREPLYRRNRIRHEVIPLLEQIAPGATRVIARVAGLLQDDAGYLAEQTARYVDELVHIEKSVCRIDRMRLAQLPTAVQRRVLITSVARASRGLYRPPANRLEALRAAAHQGTVGRRIELGGGWLALVEYNAVAIGRAAELETALRRASRLPLLPPGERVELAERVELVLENGWRLTCCTSLPGRWLLRTRHPGDRIVPEPGRPAVRLQDWLVNRKVPAYLRDWLALLADDGTVLWVAGLMGTSFLHPEGLIHVELVAEQHERGTAPVEERGTRVAEEQTLAEQLGLERVLIDEETLHRRIAELGDEITAYYHGKRPLLIGVLTGAFVFMADLVRHLPIPLSIDFIAVSSYGQATVTSGVVRIIKDLDRPIEGEDVLLVEDIVDSGLTLKYLSDLLRRRNPASLKVVALLRKQKEGALEVPIDWVGFEIPDEFVVGYGLDVAGRFRNLPFVAVYRNR